MAFDTKKKAVFVLLVVFVKAPLPAFTLNKGFSDSYGACSTFLSEMKDVVVFSR
jgi:hypothetical protein